MIVLLIIKNYKKNNIKASFPLDSPYLYLLFLLLSTSREKLIKKNKDKQEEYSEKERERQEEVNKKRTFEKKQQIGKTRKRKG